MDIQEIYRIYQTYPSVTTDTRQCQPGSIFFALKGEHFDGNDFVGEALEKGCEYAVCDHPDLPEDDRIILVEDALKTLQQLANHHRRQLNIPVIGITGTNGKTTTKELMATVLAVQYNVLYTQGNLNNHIGVPLTLLRLTSEHEIAIIEMGANHVGEIKQLVEIAEPNYGIITNVGKAHLEGFGSFEGVIQTKGELYDYLRETGGTAFVNRENTYLEAIASGLNQINYGTKAGSFVWGTPVASFPFLVLDWHKDNDSFQIQTQLVGAYNVENALAAIAVATHFNIEPSEIGEAIARYSPQNNRSQFKDTGKNHLIIDAYNANPTSMLMSLENFNQMDVSPKMVILGDMKELGPYSRDEHQKVVRLIQKSGFDRILLCGPEFSLVASEWQHFRSTDDLIKYLQEAPIAGYHILIKGSRSIQLEKTIPFL